MLNTIELCPTFAQLPFKAVLALLQHEGTAVGGEGAVCLAVKRWLDARAEGEISQEQLRQLAAEVRFAGMSSSYRFYDLLDVKWLIDVGMKPHELIRVLSYFQLSEAVQQAVKWSEDAIGQQMKAWVQRPPRPLSSFSPSIDFEVSMRQLQESHHVEGAKLIAVVADTAVWGGMRFVVLMKKWKRPSAADAHRWYILAGLNYKDRTFGSVECARFKVRVECLTGSAGQRSLPCDRRRGVCYAHSKVAECHEWDPSKLQPYATGNKLRFRASLLEVVLE